LNKTVSYPTCPNNKRMMNLVKYILKKYFKNIAQFQLLKKICVARSDGNSPWLVSNITYTYTFLVHIRLKHLHTCTCKLQSFCTNLAIYLLFGVVLSPFTPYLFLFQCNAPYFQMDKFSFNLFYCMLLFN
jgi:hypothetical protein